MQEYDEGGNVIKNQHWICKWFGCKCKKEDRKDYFDLEYYERFCGSCKTQLEGRWFCNIDDKEPEKHTITTSLGTKVEIECCPKCGLLRS